MFSPVARAVCVGRSSVSVLNVPREMPRRNPHETIRRLDQRTHNARQEHNITCGRWWPPRRFNMTASNLIYDLPELGRQIKYRIQSCCDAVTIARAHRRLDIGVRIRPACVTRRDIRWPLIAGEVVEPLIEAAQHIRLHPERRVRHRVAGFEHDPLADVDVETAGAKITCCVSARRGRSSPRRTPCRTTGPAT